MDISVIAMARNAILKDKGFLLYLGLIWKGAVCNPLRKKKGGREEGR